MKRFSLLSLMITLLIAATTITAINPYTASAQEPVYIKVEPETIEKGPGPAIDDTFTVTVKLYGANATNVPAGLQGAEARLEWDDTLLEYVSHDTKLGETGGVLNSPIIPAKDEAGTNYVWVSAASINLTHPWWGDEGIIFEVTLKVIAQPDWWYQGTYSCLLELTFTDLVDFDVNPVTHDQFHGSYSIIGPMPDPLPSIKVLPSETTVGGGTVAINDTFTVDVKLYDVLNVSEGGNLPGGLYGYELYITWNGTLLNCTEVEIVKDADGGVLFDETIVAFNNLTSGSYHLVIASIPPATEWFGTDRTMVRLTFQVIKQGVTPMTLSQSCPISLEFTDIAILTEWLPESVPHTTEDALYTVDSYPGTQDFTIVYLGSHIITIESDTIVVGATNLNFNSVEKKFDFQVLLSEHVDPIVTVTVPKNFMYCGALSEWVVNIDGDPYAGDPDVVEITEDADYTYITITFDPETWSMGYHTVEVKSTYVVAEFPTAYLTPLLMVISLIAVAAAAARTKRRELSFAK